MAKTEDGGSVFPWDRGLHMACLPAEGCRVGEGLTLRDYFAGHALLAMLANPNVVFKGPDMSMAGGKDDAAKLAFDSYGIADAMLSERAKGGA